MCCGVTGHAIRGQPNYWRNLIKRLAASKEANHITPFETVPRPHTTIGAVGVTLTCSVCGLPQPDISAKAIHEFREHGLRNHARRYIEHTNMCRFCMTVYPTRMHCLRHLVEYTTGTCLAAMEFCLPPLEEDESTRLDVLDIAVKKAQLAVKKNGRGGTLQFRRLVGPNPIDFRAYFAQLRDG